MDGFNGKPYILKIDDLGVPLFLETPKYATFVTAWEGPPVHPWEKHQAPNIEHHPKGMHISGRSTTTWKKTPQRRCVV